MSFTTQTALDTLVNLRQWLIERKILTAGYQGAFDRVIQRLSTQATQERLDPVSKEVQ